MYPHLNGKEWILGQRLEELAQNKVYQTDEVFIRLVLREGPLICQDGLE